MRIPYLFAVLVALAALVGCDAREDIVAYTAPKDQPPPRQPTDPLSAAPATAPTADAGVHWKLPDGWSQQPDKPQRIASFKTSADASAAELVLTKFPAAVMNDQLANINRYRGMVGLQPLDDASKQPVEDVTVDGTAGKRYQFDGAEKKLTIIAIPRGELAWFVRFIGPGGTIDNEKSNFDSFVQSLHW